MKNNESILQDKFIKYYYAIINFENALKNIYSESNYNKDNKGYLINLKNYEEIKQNLNYQYYNKGKKKEELIKYMDEKFYKIKKLKQIEFKTNQYLINMILNGNKYIIINENLWNELGDKKEGDNSHIIYKIESDYITFNFENEKKLYFRHNKNNQIDKYTYNYATQNFDYKPNFNVMEKILNDIKRYYEFETEFIKNLKRKKSLSLDYYSKNNGYLISKIWLDNWKKYSNYEKMKKKLIKKINDHDSVNDIIYHQEKYKLKYNELKPLEIYNYNTKGEFDDFLEKDSLVLIDSNIKDLFKTNNNSNYITKYIPIENKIYINIHKKEYLIYDSFNNIIVSKYYFNLMHLKQLIKIFYFQEKIRNLINSPHKYILDIKNNINSFFIINKQILDKYKKIFEYETLYNYLNQKETIYKNKDIDGNFPQIINELKKFDKNYIDNITKKDLLNELRFDSTDCDFKIKNHKINYPYSKDLKYIDDLQIIDEDILLFFFDNNLIQKEKVQYFEGNFIFGDGKIFLFFKAMNDIFYEIGYVNSNNDFIIEYLIQSFSHDCKDNLINLLNNIGIDSFIKKYIIDKTNNEITINRNKIAYFYKIKEDENNLLTDENINYINQIISILISIFSLETEIKNKIEESKNKNNCNYICEGYLISKKLIIDNKKLLLYNSNIEYKNINNEKEELPKDAISSLTSYTIVPQFQIDEILTPILYQIFNIDFNIMIRKEQKENKTKKK